MKFVELIKKTYLEIQQQQQKLQYMSQPIKQLQQAKNQAEKKFQQTKKQVEEQLQQAKKQAEEQLEQAKKQTDEQLEQAKKQTDEQLRRTNMQLQQMEDQVALMNDRKNNHCDEFQYTFSVSLYVTKKTTISKSTIPTIMMSRSTMPKINLII